MGLFPYGLGQAVLDRGISGCNTPRLSSQQSPSDNGAAAESRASLGGPWIDRGPRQTGWALPGHQNIHISKKRFCGNQPQGNNKSGYLKAVGSFVSPLRLMALDFYIIQQISIFKGGGLPVRKYLDTDFISPVMEMTRVIALFYPY